MRVLVAYGSERGGTAGLAQMIADELSSHGVTVEVHGAPDVPTLQRFDAVVVAGAVYMGRWHTDARRLVRRHAQGLRQRPVWLVASGPLDDSASREHLRPVPQVAKLAAAINARGEVTFGGRLEPDAKGFMASAMAKTHAGDWRDPEHVREFVDKIVADLGPAGRRAA